MAPLDSSHQNVERRQRSLQLEPGKSAPPWRVGTQRVLHHQPLVAPLARVREYPIEVVRAGGHLESGEDEWRLDAEALQQAAPQLQRLVQQRAPVEVQEIEDHEHDRDCLPQLISPPLSTEAVV